MLHRIFGRHGTGKSERIYNAVAETVRARKRAFLIVPEQQAVSAERLLIDRLGNPANMYVEVINFKRLCNRVFRESGGLCDTLPDRASGILALSHTLAAVSDELLVYRRQSNDPAFAVRMLDEITSLHRDLIDARAFDALLDDAERLGGPSLRGKLHDIALAGRGYDAFLESTLDFPGDLLDKLIETLHEYDFFKGSAVFLDSFYGFTAQELAVIERIIATADDVTVTFLCENADVDDKTFGRGAEAARGCKQAADKHGVKTADIFLTEDRKHRAPALKAIAERFSLAALGGTFDRAPSDGLVLVKCRSLYEEADYCAARAAALIAEGYRPREIAVCAYDASEYDGVIDAAFERVHVPFACDASSDLAHTPAAGLLLAAFDVVFTWSRESLAAYLKTGLAGVSDEDADLLDVYMKTWSIRGKAFVHADWQMNPAGFTEEAPDTALLARINAAKERILAPLDAFAAALDTARTAKDTAAALYTLTKDVAALSCRETFDDGMDGKAYDLLLRLLDNMVEVSGSAAVTPERFHALFKLLLDESRVGALPELLDQVRFSSASLMRTDGVKIVFLLGMNDGVFPKGGKSGGLFADGEKKLLASLGVNFTDTEEKSAFDGVFLAYTALCSASEKVFITLRKESAAGVKQYPALAVSVVQKLVDIAEETYDPADVAFASVSRERLFDTYAALPDGTVKASVRAYLSRFPDYAARIAAAETPDGTETPLSPDVLEKLYGDTVGGSYTRLETFRKCPYLCFCRYTLRLSPEPRGSLGALETGRLVHRLLEILIPRLTEKHIPGHFTGQNAMTSEVKEVLTGILAGILPAGQAENVRTRRFEYVLERLCTTVAALCEKFEHELDVSRFVPVDFELTIGPDGDVPALSVPLSDGKTLFIPGAVDRVDLFEAPDGEKYVRIVDYKTGAKSFDLAEVREGINLQMLLYLYTLTASPTARYGKLKPAGVLYQLAGTPRSTPDPESAFRENGAPLGGQSANGLLVRNMDVIFAMDATGSGSYVPVKLTKDGEPFKASESNLMDEAGFDELLHEAVDIAAGLAEGLVSGRKSAEPFVIGGNDPCKLCDVKDACPRARSVSPAGA